MPHSAAHLAQYKWVKGQSGNPGGLNHKRVIAKALQSMLEETCVKTGKSYGSELCRVLLETSLGKRHMSATQLTALNTLMNRYKGSKVLDDATMSVAKAKAKAKVG